MGDSRQGMGLTAKVSLLGVAGVLLTAGALVGLAVWQSRTYHALAQSEVKELIAADLDHITQGVYNLVKTENGAVQAQVTANLNVAEHILDNAGGVTLSRDKVTWTATNQFTGETTQIDLPRLLIGGRWLGRNADPGVVTPVVDAVANLVGERATIFQRMNGAGDMLRVGTNVKDAQGRRAIGTFIPAVNPDGSPNPVIAAVLKGQVFQGPAYVVDQAFLTAYRPIRDRTGELVGMLFVGVAREDVERRVRQAILQTRVGQTGYVYVLGGKGERKGHYIVSQRGERDGENILESKDSDGRFVIKEILGKALSLRAGEQATERYRWKNPGETEARWKIARLAYFEPWDWVIGTSVYEDELQKYREYLHSGRVRMTRVLSAAGLVITGVIGIAGILVAWTIVRPIRELTAAARVIMQGNLNNMVSVTGGGEIGTLATTFNVMTERLRQTLDGLRKSEEEYRRIFEGAREGLFQSTFEGRFLRVNPAMARIMGYDSPRQLIEEITDIKKQTYVNPSDRERFLGLLTEHGEVHGFEVQVRCRNGQVIWVSITAAVVLDEQGKPRFFEGFFTDISDRRRAEDELRRLNAELERRVIERTVQLENTNRELEAFSYSVSHDLRSPLRSLDGFSQAILEDYADRLDEQGGDYLRRIRAASQRMGALIDDLLRLSRVSRSECERRKVDLSALAASVAGEIQMAGSGRQVEWVITPGMEVNADPNLLRIVLENLLGNAWKFTSRHSHARIEVGAADYEDGRVYFVRDDGAGFDMAFAGQLFGAFQRAHSKTDFEGTGIGLATVQRIVHRHGGRVWAEGAVEKGATIYFTLPEG